MIDCHRHFDTIFVQSEVSKAKNSRIVDQDIYLIELGLHLINEPIDRDSRRQVHLSILHEVVLLPSSPYSAHSRGIFTLSTNNISIHRRKGGLIEITVFVNNQTFGITQSMRHHPDFLHKNFTYYRRSTSREKLFKQINRG
jgi:hypothetical protein